MTYIENIFLCMVSPLLVAAFWCDMLLTLAILGLLPATRKAVDA